MRLIAALLFPLVLTPIASAASFPLRPGDRVVLVGSTLIEREQKDGYWELLWTERFPGVTFRNLGWSGDTVFGEARASFDHARPEVYGKRLVEHILGLKPTVLLIAYGTNESFAGQAGLPRFLQGMEKLLDAVAPANARVALLTPTRLEDLGRPLPDPAPQNRNVRLYGTALRELAERRKLPLIDLYNLTTGGTRAHPFTDNGMHLTPYGYWRTGPALEAAFGLPPRIWRVEINGDSVQAQGVRVGPVTRAPLSFEATDELLPPVPPSDAAPGMQGMGGQRLLTIRGLPEGKYALSVDGIVVATASAEEWTRGVPLTKGPQFAQAEALRKVLVEKNRQYFHRWRPQNETYLFGFRKHEQGQNAREIPLFDPVVEDYEKQVARLRVPQAHRFVLNPAK